MRHRKKTVKLGREQGPRRALLKNLVAQVILHGKVKTTLTKAKVVRPLVERVVTRGRNASLANFRLLRSRLGSELAAKKVTRELGPRYATRPGGYTRITKLGRRKGDNAEMALIEFV